MSLLRRVLSYTSDPEVVARFQKACGIIHAPDPVNLKDENKHNGNISQHPNGISPDAFPGGKSSLVNGVCSNTGRKMDSEVVDTKSHTNQDSDSQVIHRNGVVKNHEITDKGKKRAVNGVIRTGTVPFRIENALLYYVFSFGAQLGNATFYMLFYSFSFWNFDSYVARRICLVWCICMYFGQATKDIVRLPRPKSPPVVRLETRYELEYGMPSTHAIVGTAIPLSMLIFTSGRYEYSMFIGLLVAVAWCILVCLSRIYLGMHNILDVIAGLFFAIVVMTFTVPFVDPVDKFLVTHPLSPLILLSLPIILSLLYPKLDKWSTARGDTTLILSITGGLFLGSWINYNQGFMSPNDASLPFSLNFQYQAILTAMMRLVSGVAVTLVLHHYMKNTVYASLCFVLSMDPKDPKTKQKFIVELPYKYLSYFMIALNTVYTMPLMFYFIGIPRMSYYTEI
ncbi:sphingosine-1-phosphate phosphatase 1-like [Haliotis cracherodii]|uniref:sphingosine-1-phosphate phosphatase 1-like n=1 Tax=Haliotis cracherodii TaxID=6455 RepID=UPI0039ECC942